jgi:hypothetical protein
VKRPEHRLRRVKEDGDAPDRDGVHYRAASHHITWRLQAKDGARVQLYGVARSLAGHRLVHVCAQGAVSQRVARVAQIAAPISEAECDRHAVLKSGEGSSDSYRSTRRCREWYGRARVREPWHAQRRARSQLRALRVWPLAWVLGERRATDNTNQSSSLLTQATLAIPQSLAQLEPAIVGINSVNDEQRQGWA